MTTETRELLTEPKNQERIQEIRTNMDAQVQAFIRSPKIRRWLVREFNFVTGRLYLQTKTSKGTRSQKRKLDDLIGDLRFATEILMGDTDHYKGEINEVAFPGAFYELRIVSREALALYKELVRVDVAVTKLYMSEFKGELDKDTRENLLLPVTLALINIKQFSMGYVAKTAEQLAEELEIG